LDEQFRERFSPLREGYTLTSRRREDFWYWKWKHEKTKQGRQSMSKYPISFHFYKDKPMQHLAELHAKFNTPEGVLGKTFKSPPRKPRRFLHKKLSFRVDKYRNTLRPPIGQEIFMGFNVSNK